RSAQPSGPARAPHRTGHPSDASRTLRTGAIPFGAGVLLGAGTPLGAGALLGAGSTLAVTLAVAASIGTAVAARLAATPSRAGTVIAELASFFFGGAGRTVIEAAPPPGVREPRHGHPQPAAAHVLDGEIAVPALRRCGPQRHLPRLGRAPRHRGRPEL